MRADPRAPRGQARRLTPVRRRGAADGLSIPGERRVDPRRVALTAVAFPFLVLGLLVGVLFKVVWSAVSWAYAAIKVGFELGRELQVRGRSAGGG